MTILRLDSVAPAVAMNFGQASSRQRRQAVLIACEYAATTVHLQMPDADQALDVLRGTASADPCLRHRLEDLASEFDEEYFRQSEEIDSTQEQKALQYFSKARAISALAFALSTDASLCHEAIYEAIAAVDDPDVLIRRLIEALRLPDET